MAYYINPDAILDNSIKTSSLPQQVQKKVDLYEINKQKPPIVGRCIPLEPEEGNRYYYADGLLKVKTRSNKLGFYYIKSGLSGLIFTIPKKGTQDYIGLKIALSALYTGYVQSFTPTPTLVAPDSILEEFPIFNSCIKTVDSFTSSTRSPYVTINNGELVVNKPLIYNFNSGRALSITPEPIYYRYKNNKSKQNHLKSPAFDGLTWGDHRVLLASSYYLYKYTYRKKTTKDLIERRGYYKATPIWRQHKTSQNNVLYFKTIKTDYTRYIKISNKLNDKYKVK